MSVAASIASRSLPQGRRAVRVYELPITAHLLDVPSGPVIGEEGARRADAAKERRASVLADAEQVVKRRLACRPEQVVTALVEWDDVAPWERTEPSAVVFGHGERAVLVGFEVADLAP